MSRVVFVSALLVAVVVMVVALLATTTAEASMPHPAYEDYIVQEEDRCRICTENIEPFVVRAIKESAPGDHTEDAIHKAFDMAIASVEESDEKELIEEAINSIRFDDNHLLSYTAIVRVYHEHPHMRHMIEFLIDNVVCGCKDVGAIRPKDLHKNRILEFHANAQRREMETHRGAVFSKHEKQLQGKRIKPSHPAYEYHNEHMKSLNDEM